MTIDAMHRITQVMHSISSVESVERLRKTSTMSTASVPEHLPNESSVDAQLPDKKRHSVPEWLRNESGVENKSTRKKRRKDVSCINMTKMFEESRKMFEESRKNRQERNSQILARLDTIDNMKMKKEEESQKNWKDELTSQTVACCVQYCE
jgi:hypothetical protein